MKNVVIGAICSVVFFLVLVCVMTVNGRNIRQNNLDNVVNKAVEQTVKEMQNGRIIGNKIQLTEEEVIAELAGNIASGITDDSNIDVEVGWSDLEKGIMSIRVIETYKHPNGSIGTITSEKTCIWEEYSGME